MHLDGRMSDDTGDHALPFVSVIVPVFDERRRLDALLGALSKQDYPADRFECVVVDNESIRGLRQPQALPFAVQILHERRPGSYAARNCGVRAARGEILAFTDVDCRPRADWLTSAVSLIGQPDSFVMIGGKVEVEGSGSPHRPA